jgi:CRP-like cAMP-binding protein
MSDPMFARFGREYAPGDVLFREGESGEVMFVIQSGSVRISKDIGGEQKSLAVLGPGEFLGEMAILNGKPRTATATVVETTRCLVIEAKTLESMVARNAEIALRLIKKLAKRLDSADTLVEILMHRDPKARVMLALSRHADAFGEPTAEGSASTSPWPTRSWPACAACASSPRSPAPSSSPTSAACKTSWSSSRCPRSSAGKARPRGGAPRHRLPRR